MIDKTSVDANSISFHLASCYVWFEDNCIVFDCNSFCFPIPIILPNSRIVWQVQVHVRCIHNKICTIDTTQPSNEKLFFLLLIFLLFLVVFSFFSQFTAHENSQYLAKVKIDEKQQNKQQKRDLTSKQQQWRRASA